VLTTKLRFDPRLARLEIDGFRTAFPVVTADESDLDGAMRAVGDHQLSFWDAMLWATAKRAGCRVLFSEDLQHPTMRAQALAASMTIRALGEHLRKDGR
jgi:predicted nucleic acid-binding protein